MGDSRFMNVIETSHELLEEMSCSVLIEWTTAGNEIEKFSFLSKLKRDVIDSLRTTWLGVVFLTLFDVIDNIFVIKINHDLDFIG
jgi:hypothetical protein